MVRTDINKRLDALSEILSRLQISVAWLELEESERCRGDPPVLLNNPSLATDIRNESGRFIDAATRIHEALNAQGEFKLPDTDYERWREEVLRLEREFQKLKLPKAF